MPTPQLESPSSLRDGIAAAQSGDRSRACDIFRRVIDAEPNNEAARMWLASSTADATEGLIHLRHILNVNPTNKRARKALNVTLLKAGAAATKAGDRATARSLLTELTTAEPNNESAWLWLASIATSAEEAILALENVLRISPGNQQAISALAYYREPVAPLWECPLCEQEADEEASVCPNCSAVLDLNQPDALFEGRSDPQTMLRAAERLKGLLGGNPNPATHRFIGLALFNGGQHEQGLAQLRHAVRLSPNDRALQSQVEAIAQRHRTRQDLSARETSRTASPRQYTILAVDDSPTVRKLVELTLQRVGYRVLTAGDPIESSEVIRESGVPDLMLLDIKMPGMDGYQYCKMLRGTDLTTRMPIVMLSGKDGFFDKLRGQMCGASEYITKPFQPDQLIAAVARHCPITE